MYLTNALMLNSGAIEKLILTPQFNSDGAPKPIVLVGANGSGKTGLLSITADGLIEIAALHYVNLTPQVGVGRRFFRVLGGRTQRVGSNFELSALKFRDQTHEFYYRAKTGEVTASLVSDEMKPYPGMIHWSAGNDKRASGQTAEIERIYGNGAYAFFPSTRFEIPYWANIEAMEREPEADFNLEFSKVLEKPIVVQSAMKFLKPWIMNLMMDTIVTAADVFTLGTADLIKNKAAQNLTYMNTYSGLNTIVRTILRNPQVSVNWLNRSFGERRIAIISERHTIVMPSIDCLSSGQSTLFAVFGTLLRYGDAGQISKPLNQIEGIAIIDEVDAHLHADLQHDALPELIGLFPKIQFILTSHSPLFPLGMRKLFGEDGFTLIELPSGLTIDPERFSEFEASYAYFRATLTFEDSI
jgi:hypothetical protein